MANQKTHKGKKVLQYLFLILSVATISIGVSILYDQIEVKFEDESQEAYQAKTLATTKTWDNTEKGVEAIIQQASSCVVGISKLQDKGNSIFLQNAEESLGLGTGVIVSDDGYILTNQHVAGDRYNKCYVTLDTGKEYKAEVVWSDTDVDLAMIKVNITTPTYASLGDSDHIHVGETVYAIGNPIGFEFQRTVTSGIISALDRTIKLDEESYMADLIQTDATINPGSSGGPLINQKGEVIGITSVKITSAEGIGFAIPINVAKPMIERIKTEKEFHQATLGIFAYDKEVIPYLDHTVNFEDGIYVAQVSLDGASNGVLQIGDIITKIDEITLNKMNDLREYIYTKNPGDSVNLTVLRKNKEMIVVIKLGKK